MLFRSGEGTEVVLYQKEDGTIGARVDGHEQALLTVQPALAIVRGKLSDTILRLFKRDGKVFAIGSGGRMIRKSS